MTTADAGVSIERSTATPEGSGRKPQEHGGGASNVTACRESSRTKAQERLLEMVISRGNSAPCVDGITVGTSILSSTSEQTD